MNLALIKERMEKVAKRVNPTTEKALHERKPLKSFKKPANSAKYTPRERHKNEAMPPAADLFTRPAYRTGDGEVRAVIRPGSQDFLKHPSRGYKT